MFNPDKIPDSPEKIFAEKKQKFFFNFIYKHRKEIIKLYEEYGLLPKNRKDKSLDWSNVPRHCTTEAVAGETLGKLLGLNDRETNLITMAPFYHDFYKRESIELIKANPENATAADDQANAKAKKILLEKGVDGQIVSIIDKSLGYDSIERKNVEQMSLLEKIMHYLDDITSGEELVALKERIDTLKQNPRYANINQEGIAKYGKPTYDQQFEVGSEIEADLAKILGLEKPEELPNFLKEKIRERINNVELKD
jgi:hypothetical protein